LTDNIELPGTGSSVATDEVAGEHYQRMKLVESTDGSAAAIGIQANPLATQSAEFSVRIDEGATYTYIGLAAPGADVASAEWRIKRLTNADNTILYADGDANFNNIWNNRGSLTYE
jgi:hypothetical protein